MSDVRQVPLCCPGHSRPVVFLEYTDVTADGFFLVSACKDGKPMIREGQTGDWIGTFLGHKGAVWGTVIDKQGLKAATASADFSAKVWDAVSGTELHTLEHPHIVKTVSLTDDSSFLLTGCHDKKLRVFDVSNLSAPPVELSGHSKSIRAAVFGRDGNQVLSSADDANIKVWDVARACVVKELVTTMPVTSIEISSDKKLATTTSGTNVCIWDLETLDVLHTFDIGVEVNSASLHHDKRRFVVGGSDGWVRLYDIHAGELDTLKGHFGPVHCIRFAPDGNSFASGSEDGTIRIWQTDPAAKLAEQRSMQQNLAAAVNGVGAL